jgi:hypothetical protein
MSRRFGHVFRRGERIEVEIHTPDTPKRRKVDKLSKTWAQIPHERGLELAKQARNPVLAALLILEIAVHKARSNQVKLTNDLLSLYKISRRTKSRGLAHLAGAGVISIEPRGRNEPIVTHHWYTPEGKLKAWAV